MILLAENIEKAERAGDHASEGFAFAVVYGLILGAGCILGWWLGTGGGRK